MPTRPKRLLVKLLLALAGIAGTYLAAALVTTFWPAPEFAAPPLTRAAARAAGLRFEQVYPYRERRFAARDGTALFARAFAGRAPLTVLLLHGIGADSRLMNTSAGRIRDTTGATVLALDLRGHGRSGGRPGDVDYIGQYEDDVADVLTAIAAHAPARSLILAGHSMGGGIAQRYAMLREAPEVAGYVLFAPLLGYGAPTLRPAPPGAESSDAANPYMRVHVARIVGLAMLNMVGVTALNDLPALFYNVEGAGPATYSFRALASGAPRRFEAGVEAIDAPLLVLAGTEDEVFDPRAFEDVFAAHADARVVLLEGENHNSVIYADGAMAAIARWQATWFRAWRGAPGRRSRRP